LLLCLGILLLAILFAPMVASTGWVRGKVEEALRAQLGLEVEVGALSAGWWSPIELDRLRATVRDGEFAGSDVVRLAGIRINPGLLGLLTGPETIDVEVDGLVVTIEERAGGRTNLDPVFAELAPTEPAAPPKPRPEAEPAEPGPTIRVRVADSRVELRRLPYRPPAERINPFREDVPIRPVDEGLDIYSIDAALVELDGTGPGTAVRADLSVVHAEDRATVKADLRLDGETVTGELEVDGFDLDLLDPLTAERLDGRLTLRAAGRFRPGASHGKVTLDISDLTFDSIEERWVKGRLEIEESADALRIATVELASASGRFATEGKLNVPKEEPYRPSGRLKGSFPLAPAFRLMAHRQPSENARVRFDLTTNLSATGGRADGVVHLDHFTGKELPDEITLRFALQGERASRRLQIDSLALRSAYARADLEGTIVRPPEFSAELSGEASGDIDRILDLASYFGPQLEQMHAEGHGRVVVRSLRRKPTGELELALHAGVERLRLGEPPKEFFDVQADFDGTFHDDFDRLELREAKVRNVTCTGTFHGLRAVDGFPACDAQVSGSIYVSRRILELLDLPIGEARLHPEFEMQIRSDGTRVRSTGTLTARDVAVHIHDFDYTEPKLAANWDLDFDGEELRGKAAVAGARLEATLKDGLYRIRDHAITAKGTYRVADASILRERFLDDRFDWRGEHRGNFELGRSPERFSIVSRVTAPNLVFLFDGHGVDGEATTLDARITFEDEVWGFSGSEIRVPGLDLYANAEQFELGREVRVRARSRLDHFSRYLPDVRGPVEVAVKRDVDGTLHTSVVSTELEVKGERLGRVSLLADVKLGERVALPKIELRADGVLVTGIGEVGQNLWLNLSSSGQDFGELAKLVPHLDGKGPYRIELDGVVPLGESNSRCAVKANGSVDHYEVAHRTVDKFEFEIDADFRPHRHALDDLRLKGVMRAKEAKAAAARATGIEFRNVGRGSLRWDGTGPGHRLDELHLSAKSIHIQKRELLDIQVDGRGILHHLKGDRKDAVEVYGDIRFKKIEAAVLDWVDGSARASFVDRVLVLDELEASASRGIVKGRARADLNREIVPWSFKLVVTDAQLTKDFTDPLSYVLPILRLTGQNESASGFVSSTVELAADGADWEQIRKTLRGKGNLRLREAEISGSLLMPLLSLRVGRLLLNKPYRIPDSTMTWTARNGLIRTDPLKLGGKPFNISLGGTVNLDGELNYVVHPGILLVPVRVTGTWDKLTVLPAPAEALPKWPWNK
jgi:hypothetical protein